MKVKSCKLVQKRNPQQVDSLCLPPPEPDGLDQLAELLLRGVEQVLDGQPVLLQPLHCGKVHLDEDNHDEADNDDTNDESPHLWSGWRASDLPGIGT